MWKGWRAAVVRKESVWVVWRGESVVVVVELGNGEVKKARLAGGLERWLRQSREAPAQT